MKILILLAASLLSVAARAEIVLGTPFRDGAVLQRDRDIPVWGTSSPGEHVRVEFNGEVVRKAEAVADANGRWRATLKSLEASARPSTLVVTGTNRVSVENVLVGDVWLCSGQSNMFFYVREAREALREIAGAQFPAIRQFLVKSVVTDHLLDRVDGEWEACSPATVGDFTAVGYFFAREIHRELGVPVGIIRATLGGSPIEGWMSADALASHPEFRVVAERWVDLRPRVSGGGIRNQPSGLFNGLIAPLLPYALRGIVWYQGEGNSERAGEYGLLFRTMIAQWRRDFEAERLPFLFVQLPQYDDLRDKAGESWARLREAQASALALPECGMAVTIDIGDPKALHPTNKQEVGRRLALVALDHVYRRPVRASGPRYVGQEKHGREIRIRFDEADGLRVTGDPRHLFQVAGADRKFWPAECVLDGSSAIVSSASVVEPIAVRFEWLNAPAAYLVNAADLPAAPFRTDTW
jgi:sialate O-acetylesterase